MSYPGRPATVSVPKALPANRSPFTPDLALLAFESPIFDDNNTLQGHRPRLQDSELDNGANSIKARVALIEGSFKPTPTGGLTFTLAAGSGLKADGTPYSLNAQTLNAPANAVTFYWINAQGALQSGPTPSVVRSLIAKVTAGASTITTLEDLRRSGQVLVAPVSQALKVFGGASDTDKVCTAGETLGQGYLACRDFTVPAGVTVTVPGYLRINASGNVSIQGTINVSPFQPGGGSWFGNVPGGGVTVGGGAGQGLGGGSGSNGNNVNAYVFTNTHPYGSGGACGFLSSSAGAGGGSVAGGGPGGGGLWIECANTITIGTAAVINLRGGNGGSPSVLNGNAVASGGGGGSGGTLFLGAINTITIGAGAVIDLRGGTGGNGSQAGTGALGDGGGGGGGGQGLFVSPSVNYSGASILLSGGVKGTGSPNLGGGQGGGNGGLGGAQIAGAVGAISVVPSLPQGY